MNTISAPRRPDFEHRFFVLAALAIFAVVVIGFARTYFLKFLFGTPALPRLVHLHAALMTSWFVLFLTQTCLVATHRVHWHRRLGVALAIVTIGPFVLVHATARELHAPHGDKFFIVIFGVDLVILADFAILVGCAIALRAHSDWHKRLMLLATCSIILPAIGRLPMGPLADFLVFYVCVLIPVIVDSVRHRRLHPAFGWGAPLLIASQHLAFLGTTTQAWRDFVVRLFM